MADILCRLRLNIQDEIEASAARRHFELDVVQNERSPISIELPRLLFDTCMSACPFWAAVCSKAHDD
jgi:hypothetical protein